MQKNYWDILGANKLYVWAVFLSFMIGIPMLHAQNSPTISWQTDTTKIRLGEQINLSIEVTAPRKDIVAFPEIKPSTDSIEVLGHGKIDTTYKKERAIYKTTYRITSFDEGKYHIPPIQVKAGEDIITTDPYSTCGHSPAGSLRHQGHTYRPLHIYRSIAAVLVDTTSTYSIGIARMGDNTRNT